MAYKYRLTWPKYITLRRHKKITAFLIYLLFLIIIGCSAFIWYASKQSDSIPQPQSEARTAAYVSLQTFKTPYFSFEADNSWSFAEKESSENTFVYRSSKNNIVRRDLTVYVNSLPKNLLVTHVLPVEPSGYQFLVGEVSEHCKEYLKDKIKPGNNSPVQANIESVSIKCQVDGTSNTVGIGEKNGSYQAELTSGQGKANQYYLLYNDLEFSPRFSIFREIVDSFRAL